MSDNLLIKYRDIVESNEMWPETEIVPVKNVAIFKDNYGTPLQYGQRIALGTASRENDATVILGVLEKLYHSNKYMYFGLQGNKYKIKSGIWISQWGTKEHIKYDKELYQVAIL